MIQSISFKNQNRQKPPTWSNRFRRDVNDLMYTPKDLRDIQYVKKGHSPNQKQKRSRQQRLVGNNPMKNAMEKYNIKPYNLEDSPNIKMRRSLSTRQGNNRQNPEQALHTSSTLRQKIYSNPKNSGLFLTTDFFSLKRSQSTSDLKPSTKKISLTNNYGLSHFEFGTTTIQGRIHQKYGYSLSLSKCKTQKINNTNPIFYNKNKDIQFHEHEKRNIIQKLAKYRNFKSYPPHNLYEENVQAGDGGMLDRFYDVTDRNIDMVRKKLCLDVDFNKISPRPDISKKLGTQLDYPHSYTQIAQSNTHRPLYDTQKIQRQLIIGKQVINSSKGCTR